MERPFVDCVHEWEQGLGRDSNIHCRKCMQHPGTMIHAIRERDQLAHRVQVAEAEAARLGALINAPETVDFAAAVVRESAHQRERWGSEHDGGKAPADWFWLVGYLAGKALHAQAEGRLDKALHHCISSAAALAHWHAVVLGETNSDAYDLQGKTVRLDVAEYTPTDESMADDETFLEMGARLESLTNALRQIANTECLCDHDAHGLECPKRIAERFISDATEAPRDAELSALRARVAELQRCVSCHAEESERMRQLVEAHTLRAGDWALLDEVVALLPGRDGYPAGEWFTKLDELLKRRP